VTYVHFAMLYVQLGQYGNAITELTKSRLLSGQQHAIKAAASEEVALRKAFATQGARGFWEQIQRSTEKTLYLGAFDVPQVYARLGEKEKALEALERNYEERRALGTLLNVDPAFDSLRADQRFANLVRQMGLTPNAKSE
jgi:tetratricopeptide (TPR) repeat protein